MTVVRNIHSKARNGNHSDVEAPMNPETGLSEDALDQVIEDSFPASDPPSHTPTTGLGAPKGTGEELADAPGRSRTLVIVGGIGAAIAAAVLLTALLWRKQTHSRPPGDPVHAAARAIGASARRKR